MACASVREPRFLHYPARGGSDTDNTLQPMLLKAELKRRPGTFGGEAAAPPCSVQLKPDLDRVDTRPLIQLIETDPADPGAGGVVDSRPRQPPNPRDQRTAPAALAPNRSSSQDATRGTDTSR